MSNKKKKETKESNVTQLVFLLLLITPMIIFGIYYSTKKNRKLNECSNIIKARIYKRANSSKTRHNYYEFTVNGQIYRNGFISSYDLQVGDIVFIRYYCKDPKINEEVNVKGKSYLLEKDSVFLPQLTVE